MNKSKKLSPINRASSASQNISVGLNDCSQNANKGPNKQKGVALSPLSPSKKIHKADATTEEKFNDMLKRADSMLKKRHDVGTCTKLLEDLLRFVENSIYYDKKVRASHINALYKYQDRLDNVEADLKKNNGKLRTKGNSYLEKISSIMNDTNNDSSSDLIILIEEAINCYKLAGDNRWQALAILPYKIKGNEYYCSANQLFSIGKINEALQHAKKSFNQFKLYRKSEFFGQCQLLLSLGNQSVNWNHDMHQVQDRDDLEKFEQMSNCQSYFIEKAKLLKLEAFDLSRNLFQEGNIQSALDQIEISKAFYCWIKEDIPLAIFTLEKKCKKVHLQRITQEFRNLTHLDHFALSKIIEKWCSSIVDLETSMFLFQENSLLYLFEKLMQLKDFRGKVVQSSFDLIEKLVKTGFEINVLWQLRAVSSIIRICSMSRNVNEIYFGLHLIIYLTPTKQYIHKLLHKEDIVSILISLRAEFQSEVGLMEKIIQLVLQCIKIRPKCGPFLEESKGLRLILAILKRHAMEFSIVQPSIDFFYCLVKEDCVCPAISFDKLLELEFLPTLYFAIQSHFLENPNFTLRSLQLLSLMYLEKESCRISIDKEKIHNLLCERVSSDHSIPSDISLQIKSELQVLSGTIRIDTINETIRKKNERPSDQKPRVGGFSFGTKRQARRSGQYFVVKIKLKDMHILISIWEVSTCTQYYHKMPIRDTLSKSQGAFEKLLKDYTIKYICTM